MKLLIVMMMLCSYAVPVSAATLAEAPGEDRMAGPHSATTAELLAAAKDKELLSKQVVDYFKRVAGGAGEVHLKITLSDAYCIGTILEDEKIISADSLPTFISTAYVIEKSDALRELLPSFTFGKDLGSFWITTTIWVEAPSHREKVNGFCNLA